MYHMITGMTPYHAGNAFAIIQKHLNEELVPPDEINPSLSVGPVELIGRMMAKLPEDRHASMSVVVEEIDRLLAGKKLAVAPLPPGRSTWQLSVKQAIRLKKQHNADET